MIQKLPCVFLFDLTGIMAEPWAAAGHPCLLVDIQHPPGLNYRGNNIWTFQADLRAGFQLPREWAYSAHPLAFGAAFCPCDHLAVSGARWFEGKGLRLLAWSIEMFATAAEFFSAAGCPFVIENPVSTISSYWRKSDYTMHPFEFTGYAPEDNYTKKTCLWVGGGFVMPEKFMADDLGEPDDRIHKCPPGPDRANKRSATPRGFSAASHEANRPDRQQVAA